ncbi:MAG: ABC transporter permease [Angelakisella sp.]
MNKTQKRRLYLGLVRKAAAALLCLLLIVLINFFLPRMMPGDPVLMLTGMDEDALSQQQYDAYKVKLGLDKPMSEQFLDYLGGIFTGNLGYSYHYNEPVSTLLWRRIPNTLQLAVPAILLSSLLAVWLGCSMGYCQGSRRERLTSSVMIVLDAVPGFLLSMVAVYVFAFTLRWLPLGGLSSIVPPKDALAAFGDRVWHLLLPVLVLTFGTLPSKYMLIRNAVAAESDSRYLLYARARGLTSGRIKYVHLFKNICPPFIAMLGVNIGLILAGSMICETIFSIKGMGELFYSAITARDFPVMQGCLFVTAVTVIAATMAADLAVLLIDPKVRWNGFEK